MGWASQLNVHTAVFAIFWQWTILLLMANVVSIWWYVQSWCLLTSGICIPNIFLMRKNILVSCLKQNCFSFIAICQSKILIRLKLLRFFSSSNYWFQYYLKMCRARRRMWKATREVANWNDIGSAKVWLDNITCYFISVHQLLRTWTHITNPLKRNRRNASGQLQQVSLLSELCILP